MNVRRGTWHDAFDAQMQMWRFMRGDFGQRVVSKWAALETRRQPTKQVVYQSLIQAEEPKLLGASPVFVSAEMCDVIEHAAASFEPEELLPTDVFPPQAFVYFERPFLIPDRKGNAVNVKAFAYCPLFATEGVSLARGDLDGPHDGIALSFYSSTRPDEIEGDSSADELVATDEYLRERGHTLPELTMLHLSPVWFGLDPGEDEIDVDTGTPTGTSGWWKLMQVTLRLANQQIAVRHRERLDRPSRREAARRGFDAEEVLVVRLRREKAPERAEPYVDANYSHRFIVGGHWRKQWYPSAATHRQIWISPYVKGPEHLPLVIRPRRAFTLNR